MKKAIILFKGSNCVPCGHFEPVFEEVVLDAEFRGDVYVVVDDIALMREMSVRTVPTVVFAEVLEPGMFRPIKNFSGKELRRATLATEIDDFNAE